MGCLKKLRAAIETEGVFYATYFETATSRANPPKAHDHGLFYYTRQDMERFGSKTDWHAEYIGDWKHPRNQVIVRYRPRK
jgi:hypothetical protein